MSSALMKDLHLCPVDLLVFIFCPNMVSMRSPDTTAHVSYSMWHRRYKCTRLFPDSGVGAVRQPCRMFQLPPRSGWYGPTSSSGVIFISSGAEPVSRHDPSGPPYIRAVRVSSIQIIHLVAAYYGMISVFYGGESFRMSSAEIIQQTMSPWLL